MPTDSSSYGASEAVLTPGLDTPLAPQAIGGVISEAPLEPKPTMDGTFVRAIAWTSAGKWSTQALTWASTIIAARLLAPSDYGLMGMATMYLGLINLISEFGLGQSVITLRHLSTRQVAQINSLAVGFGAGLFLFSTTLASSVGRFFHAPQLPVVILVMSVGFLIAGFQVIPDALLQRELRFKRIASYDTIRALVQASTTVLLAWRGFGYWSLAFGSLSGTVIYAVLILASRRHSFAWPNLSETRSALGFSADILGSRVAWYSYSNSDFLVAGRLLGETSLGAYTMAWTIASTPVEKITNMVMKVTPAFFAAVQHDKAQLRRYLVVLTEGLSLLCFPACVGLAMVADQFVRAVLGPRWIPAIMPLRLLALYAALRSITTLLPALLNAIQRSRFVMLNTFVAAVVFPASFYLVARWGTTGISATWIILYPCITAPLIWKTLVELDLSVGKYFGAIMPAFLACLVMALVVGTLRLVVPSHWSPLIQLIVSTVGGAAAYTAFILLTQRERLRNAYALIQGSRMSTGA
jgi:O-antigen/teichoic acid export membrane protein